jgi:hypothetical protein
MLTLGLLNYRGLVPVINEGTSAIYRLLEGTNVTWLLRKPHIESHRLFYMFSNSLSLDNGSEQGAYNVLQL